MVSAHRRMPPVPPTSVLAAYSSTARIIDQSPLIRGGPSQTQKPSRWHISGFLPQWYSKLRVARKYTSRACCCMKYQWNSQLDKRNYTTRQPQRSQKWLASVWASDWNGHAINSHWATGALWRCPKKWQSSQAEPLLSTTSNILQRMLLSACEYKPVRFV